MGRALARFYPWRCALDLRGDARLARNRPGARARDALWRARARGGRRVRDHTRSARGNPPGQSHGSREGRQAGSGHGRGGRVGRGAEAPLAAHGRHRDHEGQGVRAARDGRERRRQGGVSEPGLDLPQRLLRLGREPLRPRALQEAEERLQGLRGARRRPHLLQHPPADERLRAGARQPLLGARRRGRRLRDPGRARRDVGGEGLARALRRERADGAGGGGRRGRPRSPSTPRSTSAPRTRTSSARTTKSARSTEGAATRWD